MKTIAICNLKGGVGKTTTAINLAADLARLHEKRVLVIDADSQCNTTGFFEAGSAEDRGDTLADLLGMSKGERTEFSVSFQLAETIRPSSFPGIDLLPGDIALMGLDISSIRTRDAWVESLALGLPGLSSRYDYTIIDLPPAFNAAASAALLAADEVLVPVKMDAFALEGMANLMAQISSMRQINPKLEVLGLVPVMWYKSDEILRAEAALRDTGLPILPRIRRSNRVDDSTFRQQPLISCAPKCGACKDYKLLARVIVQRGGRGNG